MAPAYPTVSLPVIPQQDPKLEWSIFDRRVIHIQGASCSSMAAGTEASTGQNVCVSLRLLPPPLSSYMEIYTDELFYFFGQPKIIAAHGDLALIHGVIVVEGVGASDYPGNFFLYKASPECPWLRRLPSPGNCWLGRADFTGVLHQGGDDFIVAKVTKWVLEHTLDISELWSSTKYRFSYLPRTVPEFPWPDLKEKGLIHFIVRESAEWTEHWIVTLDMNATTRRTLRTYKKYLNQIETPYLHFDTTNMFWDSALLSSQLCRCLNIPAASVREGDWNCPQCGNANFSFRNVCNHGACGAPRPSPSPSPRMMPAPPPAGYDRSPLFYGGGGGAPSPIPLGSGSYGAPYPHLGMCYGYGPPVGAPGSYGLFSLYGQPGPMGVIQQLLDWLMILVGNTAGMGYGPGPELGRYSYGF
ncbi:uncharacterized protein C2845_PM03G06660 [Panicum miliaceum]|uniref:RanBP2-type domain-containing protein n=1 Tax=Panicum miliaceum TaxID=4540 RepID=A0A3L6T928_PANMI|nr:uncharacterized protein C2845_PM03G06660 [Panicum miliaceum]